MKQVFYYPHFTDEETEAQTLNSLPDKAELGFALNQCSMSIRWQERGKTGPPASWRSNLCSSEAPSEPNFH